MGSYRPCHGRRAEPPDDACVSSRVRWTCDIDFSMTQRRTGDPKASTQISGIRGLGPSTSRWRRWTPSASYAVESSLSYNYNMIEQTTRVEAASGPDGDDNGPGSEPLISSAMTRRSCRAARWRPLAAVGKPSFAYFTVDYLPHDV
ncbi:hypothetical protein THAOC_14892 [Thalassiosira oceanica]|uniref:Uncharacterized protein n=1 Tax=Thalassiosira oceanica TaxID=159749 RepID=K0SE25_THAOC|nr:hypothetical protein THAOC_14892 [Thalassiosira oceanica]|eukprot:EJK64378.1 hypothetical protein THAOC_14892 [Thalassiosira oceanica]